MSKPEVIQGTSNWYERFTGNPDEVSKRFANRRQVQDVRKKIYEASLKSQGTGLPRIDMFVTVKSNYARDRVVVVGNGDLVLNFDRNGIAKMPAGKRYLLEPEMTARPGRYTILEDVVQVAPVVAPEVVEVEVSADTSETVDDTADVVDVVVEEEKSEETKKVNKPKGKKISKEND